MDFLTYLWFLTTSVMLIHQHQASSLTSPPEEGPPVEEGPTAQEGPTVEEGPLVQLPHAAHRREKRCSCENQKDKECIFFCHIGIVWVNTPSHLVPYGFGSARLKREVQRCFCKRTRDHECVRFCSLQTHTEGDNADRTKRCTAAFWEKRSRRTLKPHT